VIILENKEKMTKFAEDFIDRLKGNADFGLKEVNAYVNHRFAEIPEEHENIRYLLMDFRSYLNTINMSK